MFLASVESNLSSAPSLLRTDSPASTDPSGNLGILSIAAVSWLMLNMLIALCLVWAERLKKAKKVARQKAIELPAGDVPAELKEDSRQELDTAPPELNEDTFHEMFAPPTELNGDFWPELDGRPF